MKMYWWEKTVVIVMGLIAIGASAAIIQIIYNIAMR